MDVIIQKIHQLTPTIRALNWLQQWYGAAEF